jgi:hypothetical protein
VTPLNSILLDIKIVPVLLVLIGVIGIAVIYFTSREKRIGGNQAKGSLQTLDLEKRASNSLTKPYSDAPAGDIATPNPEPTPRAPEFQIFQRRTGAIADLFRAFLVLLSLVVAALCLLLLLPQPTVDNLARDLQAHYGAAQPEKIALLFLGDEAKGNEFQVQGVVRNISNTPIEQLDAAVRLYSHAGGILETVLLRMDKETIAPDETSQFRLVYPNYKMEFSKYAVEFKLRQGALMTYKDMRSAHPQINPNP